MNRPKPFRITAILSLFSIYVFMLLSFQPVAQCADVRILYDEGSKLLSQKDFTGAIQKFEEAIAVNDRVPQFYNAKGIAYLQMPGGHDQAITAFEQALEIDPEFVDAYLNLGITFTRSGKDLDRAIAEFERAIELSPQSIRGNYSLGWLYLHYHQDAPSAIERFEVVLEVEPEHIDALYGVGMAYLTGGQNAKVLKSISMLRLLGKRDLAQQLEEMAYAREQPRQEDLEMEAEAAAPVKKQKKQKSRLPF